jgi:hypothetical protein
MSRVSIVLPTYNRADTLLRAIDSVRAQTFEDWELHVVDDGSTDGTPELFAGIDSRVQLHRRPHLGVAEARNHGLRASRGEIIAFLDSDDEWTAHHLELSLAFLDAFPGEQVVSGEFWIDHGTGSCEKHFRVSMGQWFLGLALQIRSASLDLPPGESDDYLRFYSSREAIGPWGDRILARTPYAPAALYRGELFQKWRWGFLLALQPTVLRRETAERVGPFDTSYPIASDFGWLASLCRIARTNTISAPGCIKHDFSPGRRKLVESHLATGKTALQFAKDLLRWHEELFWAGSRTDPELTAIRGLCQLYAGRIALSTGEREQALEQLRGAAAVLPGPTAPALLWLARLVANPRASRVAYAACARASSVFGSTAHKLRRLSRLPAGRPRTAPIG